MRKAQAHLHRHRCCCCLLTRSASAAWPPRLRRRPRRPRPNGRCAFGCRFGTPCLRARARVSELLCKPRRENSHIPAQGMPGPTVPSKTRAARVRTICNNASTAQSPATSVQEATHSTARHAGRGSGWHQRRAEAQTWNVFAAGTRRLRAVGIWLEHCDALSIGQLDSTPNARETGFSSFRERGTIPLSIWRAYSWSLRTSV